MWQPAPVQPKRHRHLFQRMQVPPWAHGGEHMAEIHTHMLIWIIHRWRVKILILGPLREDKKGVLDVLAAVLTKYEWFSLILPW